jgi:hypothetical protein
LALDFLNTCPVQNGEPLELLPDFNAVLRWFQAAGLLSSRQGADLQQQWGGSAHARDVTAAMRELREKLRKKVLAWEDTGKLHRVTIDELNQLMTEHPMLTRLKRDTNEAMTELWFEASQPEDLFAPCSQVWALRAAFL